MVFTGHIVLASVLFLISIVQYCKLRKRGKMTNWELNTSLENREKEYYVALWGILMVAFWALSTIAYLLMVLSDLTHWPNYILNMIFADVRYYLECFIILTFAMNELMNSRMELLQSQISNQTNLSL